MAKSKQMSETVKEMVIFKTGTWNGETFTEADLDRMAKSFNADEPIPFIIGHSSDYKGHTRIPAFGRIVGGLKRIGGDLIAYGIEFSDKLAEWVREGFYPQRSVEITRDNTRVLAVGMLGAAPPAVKGLPGNDEALNNIALEFSSTTDAKVIEFAEVLDEASDMAVEDTVKTVTQYCGDFLRDMEDKLRKESGRGMMMERVWQLQSDLLNCLDLHQAFLDKVDKIEENQKGEYAERYKGWREFVQNVKSLFNQRKESDMDAKKEQEYQTRISTLEAQVKEFTDAKAAEAAAKAQADADAAKAASEAADATLKGEIKTFCDKAVEEGRMTPAMRGDAEKPGDEALMFTLGKTSPEALKSFQQKYANPAVPLGEHQELNQQNTTGGKQTPQLLSKAADYVKAHPKEFSGMSDQKAVARAVFLATTGKIKL